ncbi:MAG: ribonuclease P protein component [Candidatus Dormibacteria bacterium]
MSSRHRLTARRQFAAVLAGRTAARSGHVKISVAANGGLPMRAGFALRGIRTAVLRNRLRRRLRAVVGERAPLCDGVDVVVAAGAEAAGQSFGELSADVVSCLDRLVPIALSRPQPSPPARRGSRAQNEMPAVPAAP